MKKLLLAFMLIGFMGQAQDFSLMTVEERQDYVGEQVAAIGAGDKYAMDKYEAWFNGVYYVSRKRDFFWAKMINRHNNRLRLNYKENNPTTL